MFLLVPTVKIGTNASVGSSVKYRRPLTVECTSEVMTPGHRPKNTVGISKVRKMYDSLLLRSGPYERCLLTPPKVSLVNSQIL